MPKIGTRYLVSSVLVLAAVVVATGCSRTTSSVPAAPSATSRMASPTTPRDGFQRDRGFPIAALAMNLDTITTMLQTAVEDRLVTQEQASDVWEWWGQKPAFLTETLFNRVAPSGTPRPFRSIPPSLIPPAFDGTPGLGGFGLAMLGISLETLNVSLAEAVQQGSITEEQANEIREWWGQKPVFLNETLFPRTAPTGFPPFTQQAP